MAGGAGGEAAGPMDNDGMDGTFGSGGAGGTSAAGTSGGGGGGGWYGGGGGAGTSFDIDPAATGGGGGSGYADPSATYVYYESGQQTGDGAVQLTWVVDLDMTPTTTSTTTTVAPGPSGSFGSDPGGGVGSLTTTPGQSVTISTAGWMSSTEVTATMYSDPVHLGRFPATPTGSLVATLTIPSTAPAGAHRIELTGLGANGSPATVVLALTVQAPARSAAAQPSALSFVG
jgi:hypothetical protein